MSTPISREVTSAECNILLEPNFVGRSSVKSNFRDVIPSYWSMISKHVKTEDLHGVYWLYIVNVYNNRANVQDILNVHIRLKNLYYDERDFELIEDGAEPNLKVKVTTNEEDAEAIPKIVIRTKSKIPRDKFLGFANVLETHGPNDGARLIGDNIVAVTGKSNIKTTSDIAYIMDAAYDIFEDVGWARLNCMVVKW